MGPHVTSESEIASTDSAALRTSRACLRLTDSFPYISVACQSLQVTWLDAAIEKIGFDVVDEAFLWATS